MGRIANYARRLDERFHEHRLGIRTTEWHTLIDPQCPERRGYGPTSFRDWRTMRRYIVADPKSAFVDYGAGLGRVAILAAQMPFGRIIGVEFDSDLVNRARANVERAQVPVEMICADATTFEVPANASTLFFCNPFTGSILAAVLEQVRASQATQPRQLICNLPEESAFEAEISKVSWLRLERHIPLSDRRKCLIFSAASEA